MRVRILSGHLSGEIVELPQHEAEADLATGFAERASEEVLLAPEDAYWDLPLAEASPLAEPAPASESLHAEEAQPAPPPEAMDAAPDGSPLPEVASPEPAASEPQ